MEKIHISGELSKEIMESQFPISIAVKVEKCVWCHGSGCKEPDFAEGDLPAKEAVICDHCNGAGLVADLDEAIACKIITTTTIEPK